MSSQKLMKVLTTPSKIASALDWRKAGGSVLSIDIHKDRIGFAIASHPSYGDKAAALEPIQLAKKGKVNQECKDRLSQLVKDYKVCGFVVSFPVQQDTGRMGAACGRVLHTLDDLLTDSNIATPNRPLCLWDSLHATAEREDEWGRCAAYTKTSDKKIHLASKEQYNHDEAIVASQVWEDFCRVNWPDLQVEEECSTAQRTEEEYVAITHDSLDADEWEEAKVALL